MPDIWLTVPEFGVLAQISRRGALKATTRAIAGDMWRGSSLLVRNAGNMRGGKSGLRYEVLLSSLPEPLQRAFRGISEDDCTAIAIATPAPLPSKFIAAPNQSATEAKRYAVLRLVMETEFGTSGRAQAIKDASHHHNVSESTIRKWVSRCEAHGWDLDALGRKRPTDAGKQRVWVSRAFDKHFRAAGYDHDALADLADWLTRTIAGWWQAPEGRSGWMRVRLETVTSLSVECKARGFNMPAQAFDISRRRIEELRFHRAVDIMQHDAKRHDDAKPRIRRDNSLFQPMEQVVMDVKPLDCMLSRPDGTRGYPRLIGFLDSGTRRFFGRIVLLPKNEGVRQEHVTSAFLDMVQTPGWGFPQQLYRDNGTEYAHFNLIREALKMIADDGKRTIVNAKPYSGASKPIESYFALTDLHVTRVMAGYTGPNRMDKKTKNVGCDALPYAGPVEAFEKEFFLRLQDMHSWEIRSGPFKGRSPLQIYSEHVEKGWRPVSVNRFALDCAFAKQLGERKVDRGAITLNGQRFRHPELAAFVGRRVPVIQPYQRNAWPIAELPEIGPIYLEPEMLMLPGDISGAIESARMQKHYNKAIRRLKEQANPVDGLDNVLHRVAMLPTAAAPAPLIDLAMSKEAERFAGARIAAEQRQSSDFTEEQRRKLMEERQTQRLLRSQGYA